MQRLVVRPSGPLAGEIHIAGAKNSVLKLMAAVLLAEGTYELSNVPEIADVEVMSELLGAMGVTSEHPDGRADLLRLVVPDEIRPEAPYELVEQIRASITVLGPLLARCGRARVSFPGGDDFGSRPIDMHLRGLEALGAHFELRHGYLEATVGDGLRGADVTLEFPSVGATENIVLAAVGAKGTTVLENAAREPEIVDLCMFLESMGAQLEGVGSPTITVHGVAAGELHGAGHAVVPDRIEVATFLAAVGVAGGEVHLSGARANNIEMLLRKMAGLGVTVTDSGSGLWASSAGRLRSVDIASLPYPGVATDFIPLLAAMLAVADGVGIITENLFAGRFRYLSELARMGADVRTDSHHAVIRGVARLSAAPVRAHDIRAGAALVVAALAADGDTVIADAHHVDRGYAGLDRKLRMLGVDIQRI